MSTEQPQSYTCPYCGNMGFSEVTLSEHVGVQHSDSSSEVVSFILSSYYSKFWDNKQFTNRCESLEVDS